MQCRCIGYSAAARHDDMMSLPTVSSSSTESYLQIRVDSIPAKHYNRWIYSKLCNSCDVYTNKSIVVGIDWANVAFMIDFALGLGYVRFSFFT